MSDLTYLREIEKWYSASEAGRVVQVSGQYMTSLARQKDVKAVKTSLGWLFDPEDTLRYARHRNQERARRKAMV